MFNISPRSVNTYMYMVLSTYALHCTTSIMYSPLQVAYVHPAGRTKTVIQQETAHELVNIFLPINQLKLYFQSNEVKNSNAMELEGLKRSLTSLQKADIHV